MEIKNDIKLHKSWLEQAEYRFMFDVFVLLL